MQKKNNQQDEPISTHVDELGSAKLGTSCRRADVGSTCGCVASMIGLIFWFFNCVRFGSFCLPNNAGNTKPPPRLTRTFQLSSFYMADGTLYVGEQFVMAILVGCCCGRNARCERFTLLPTKGLNGNMQIRAIEIVSGVFRQTISRLLVDSRLWSSKISAR